MTAQSRSVLKARFENGDVPTGSDYADVIDSFISLTDTAEQSMAGPLNVPRLVVTTVCAQVVFASSFAPTTINASVGTFTSVTGDTVGGSAGTFTELNATTVSGDTAIFTTLVTAGLVRTPQVCAGSANFDRLALNSAMAVAGILTTAAATAGTGDAIPASAAGFLIIQVSGSSVAIPYFPVG